jgi:HK97 family phage major capsid protein
MTTLEERRTNVAYVETELLRIHDEAGDDPLDDETQTRFDAGEQYIREQRAEISQIEARNAAAEELRARVATDPTLTSERSIEAPNVNTRTDPWDMSTVRYDSPTRMAADMQSRAVTAIEQSRSFVESDHRESATRKVERLGRKNGLAEQILLTTAPAYTTGFYRAMSGELDFASDDEKSALSRVRDLTRAMALSDVTGVLVPAHLDPTVILTNNGATNPFRDIADVRSITTNVWTGTSSAGITAGWTGSEATQVGDDAPSFSNPAVTAFMADAFVPISFQAFEDLVGGEDEIIREIVDAKDRLEAEAFAVGSGSDEPNGIVTALDANTNAEVETTTSNVFGVDDVYALFEAVPPRWRSSGTWVSNIAIINDIRQFGTDSLSTQTVDLTADGVTRILGRPVVESSEMDGVIAAGGEDNFLVYGDFSNYRIVDRIGLSVEFVPNLFATGANRPSGQRGWLAHWRTGADSIVDVAFRLLQAHTNS